MRLQTKTAISLCVTALIPVGLLGFTFLPVVQKALTQWVARHLESVAAVQVARIGLILNHRRDLVRQIGSLKMLGEGLSAYSAHQQAEDRLLLQSHLQSILSATPSLQSITLLDLEGMVVATTDPGQHGISYGGAPFFQPALTQPLFVSLSTAPEGDSRRFIDLAGPMLLEKRTVGVVFVRTETGELSTMARDDPRLGRTGETFLATADPNRNLLVYLTPRRFDLNAMSARRPPSTNGSNTLAAAILAGRSGFFQNIADDRGRWVLAVLKQIASTPWFLVVQIDQEEAFAPVTHLRGVLIVSLGLTILLIGIVALWISRSITAPILHLEEVVQKLDAGHLSTRTTLDSKDEFCRLATAFNHLAERLERSHRQLQTGLADLTRSNADLTQFAYAASHDLQEPLRIIVSYLALLQRRYQGHLDQNADEFIAFVVDAAKRMQRLIHDLLIYSRVGREKTLAPTDLNEALQTALDNLQAARHEAAAEITAGPLPTVMARSTEMVQLLQNLLGNAIKFRGERPLKIHVGATRAANGLEWVFSVRDNGIGVDPSHVDRIFIIFERLHGIGGKYAGSGIGLALCRKIVEQHGGRIWVESVPDQGSTFRFTLPVADAQAKKTASVEVNGDGNVPIVQDRLHVEAVEK